MGWNGMVSEEGTRCDHVVRNRQLAAERFLEEVIAWRYTDSSRPVQPRHASPLRQKQSKWWRHVEQGRWRGGVAAAFQGCYDVTSL